MIEDERPGGAREGREESQVGSVAVLGDRRNVRGDGRTRTAGRAEVRPREHESLDRGARSDDLRPGHRAVAVFVQLHRLVQIADVEVPFGTDSGRIFRTQGEKAGAGRVRERLATREEQHDRGKHLAHRTAPTRFSRRTSSYR